MSDDKRTPTPAEAVQNLYEEQEARTAKAMEELVGRPSFGELLALVAGNAIGLMKLGTDAADMVVRNLRLAGRRDVIGLSRQLARTEDKLERVLQEVEQLQEAQEQLESPSRANGNAAAGEGAPRRKAAGRS
jgi:hypothetical protein